MNYSSCLLFLVALSIVNLLILASLYILDFASVASKQKIIFIRIGLVIICSAMFLFLVMQFFSFHTLEIIFPDKLINKLPINSVLPTITKLHIDWEYYLFVAYVAGFFVMLTRIFFSYLNASRQLTYSDEVHIQGHTVLLSKNVQSPLSFGLPKANIQEYGALLLTMISIQPNNFIFTNIRTSTLKKRFIAMKSKTTRRPLLVSILCTALLFSGGAAIATTDGMLVKKNIYKIASKLFIDGQLVSSPVIINNANQKSSIQISDKGVSLKIALIVKDVSKDNIRVNYDIQYTNGAEKMHSKPEMILIASQEGVIRIASDTNHLFEMKVVVERQ